MTHEAQRRLCEPWEMNRRVPDVVANAAVACGAGEWLRDLPGLIAELEAEWSVSVGRPFPHASEAFVAEATLADGTPAVLKLLIPQDGAAGRQEITMLRLAGGRGCVGLLRDDAARTFFRATEIPRRAWAIAKVGSSVVASSNRGMAAG